MRTFPRFLRSSHDPQRVGCVTSLACFSFSRVRGRERETERSRRAFWSSDRFVRFRVICVYEFRSAVLFPFPRESPAFPLTNVEVTLICAYATHEPRIRTDDIFPRVSLRRVSLDYVSCLRGREFESAGVLASSVYFMHLVLCRTLAFFFDAELLSPLSIDIQIVWIVHLPLGIY